MATSLIFLLALVFPTSDLVFAASFNVQSLFFSQFFPRCNSDFFLHLVYFGFEGLPPALENLFSLPKLASLPLFFAN